MVRIGYPYACSTPQDVREAVVILSPSDYPGFSDVVVGNEKYQIVETDTAAHILDSLPRGVYGKLMEAQDNRKSIARRGRIIGQGSSMQLALVLAVFSKRVSGEAPLVLCSAAVDHPRGAPKFVDAVVKTYCSEEVAKESLLRKYEAAVFSQAVALVLPKRDAEILAQCLQQENFPLAALQQKISTAQDSPAIVGLEENQLPQLAKIIGINPYHYQRKKHVFFSFFLIAVICLLFTIILQLKSDEKNDFREAKIMLARGLQYQNGKEVKQDLSRAVYWIRKSAELGYSKAMCSLGIKYNKGIGVKKNSAEAIRWFTKAANLNDVEGMFLLGTAYFKFSPPNYKKSLYWYKKAAQHGNVSAMYVLAFMYYAKKEVEDLVLAKKWAEKATNLGHEKAPQLLKLISLKKSK